MLKSLNNIQSKVTRLAFSEAQQCNFVRVCAYYIGRLNPFSLNHQLEPLMRDFFLILFLVFFGLSCSDRSPEEPQDSNDNALPIKRSVEVIADEFLAALLIRHPEIGTNYSLPGVRHDRLTDNSPHATAAWKSREDAWLRDLDRIDKPGEVGSRDWVTYGILRETLESSSATRICHNRLWAASTTTAWYTTLPFLFEIQPVDSAELQQQALDRLRALVVYIDTEIANLRLGLAAGYSAPRITVEDVPAAVRELLADDSPLLSPGVRAGDTEYVASVRAVFDDEVAPAVERFAGFIENEYLPQTRRELALSFNTNGAECYPELVRYFATIKPAAEEIHQLGLVQIAGIRAEMQAIIDKSFPGESIESLMKNLNSNPKYTFASREDVLNYALQSVEAAKTAMGRAFGVLPRADMLIKPYPSYREAGGTGEYQSSSEDGTRPGIYYIAVTDPNHRSIAGQQSVLYHEGYPGHHLQGAIALELGDRVHPIARYLYNNGFAEGWALYAERLAGELGLYTGPLDEIGLLSDQAARAARLVVDSGLHTKNWTRQQAVDYMLANTAWPPVDIEAEVNRYISWPGQATSYMLGMLEIRRLRNLAEAELGAAFDLRAFHDRVLGSGSITLPMLEESIEAWISGQQ